MKSSVSKSEACRYEVEMVYAEELNKIFHKFPKRKKDYILKRSNTAVKPL